MDIASLQSMVTAIESQMYSNLFTVRLRYRQMKNLMADSLDAIESYLGMLVTFSNTRLQMMERLEVAMMSCVGTDQSVSAVTKWCRTDAEQINVTVKEIREKFEESVTALFKVNDAVDTRLRYIDQLAEKMFREKEKWKKDLKATSKASTLTKFAFGRLTAKNDDMVARLGELETAIGTFADELDVWVSHGKDVLAPCLMVVLSSLVRANSEGGDQNNICKQAVVQLQRVAQEIEYLRLQSLTKRGEGGRHEWPKLVSLLASPVQRLYYLTYLQQAHNAENLHFYEAVNEFRAMASAASADMKLVKARAVHLVDEYVKDGAPSQINIIGPLREKTVHSVDGSISPNMFDEAQDHVFRMMERDAQIHFKSSSLGAEMIRRLSHCKLQSDQGVALKLSEGVSLKVEQVDINVAVEQEQPARRRTRTWSVKMTSSRSSMAIDSDGSASSRSSKVIPTPQRVSRVESPKTEQKAPQTLEEALARSPRTTHDVVIDLSEVDSSEDHSRKKDAPTSTTSPPPLQKMPLPSVDAETTEGVADASSTVEEELLSPRDMLRNGGDAVPEEKEVASSSSSPRTRFDDLMQPSPPPERKSEPVPPKKPRSSPGKLPIKRRKKPKSGEGAKKPTAKVVIPPLDLSPPQDAADPEETTAPPQPQQPPQPPAQIPITAVPLPKSGGERASPGIKEARLRGNSLFRLSRIIPSDKQQAHAYDSEEESDSEDQ